MQAWRVAAMATTALELSQHLARTDHVAGAHLRGHRLIGRAKVTVRDGDDPSPREHPGIRHEPIAGSGDQGPGRCAEVDTAMTRRPAGGRRGERPQDRELTR